MKIGIMGGTFDPIHIGHLLLGEFAREEFQLDEVWYLPNGNPPHKQTEEMDDALHHRVEMVRLAIREVPYFKLCMQEADKVRHFYTYKTMQELNALWPAHEFYFILGADSLFAIEQWKEFRRIFPTCTILAAVRDDKNACDIKEQIRYLKEKYDADIRFLRAPYLEISSTLVRSRAAQLNSIYCMVPDSVLQYIKEHHLYQTEEEKNA